MIARRGLRAALGLSRCTLYSAFKPLRSAHSLCDPFGPSTTATSSSSAAFSLNPVTLPALQETWDPNFLAIIPAPKSVAPTGNAEARTRSHPFLDALKSVAEPATILTENGATALGSTGSACLDVFSGMNDWTDPSAIDTMLHTSWKEDPITTLRLIWHSRSVPEGHSSQKLVPFVFGWLFNNHPKTAIANLPLLVAPVVQLPGPKTVDGQEKKAEDEIAVLRRRRSHGYWKDLLNILMWATNGMFEALPAGIPGRQIPQRQPRRCPPLPGDPTTREARIKAALERNARASKAARFTRRAVQHQRLGKVEQHLATKPAYRALYVAVVRHFTDALAEDLRILRRIATEDLSTEERLVLSHKISLAGKWAPSPGGSHDRHTNIATAIARCLYEEEHLIGPVAPLSSPITQEDAHRVRGIYSRWCLSPLRRFTQVTETYMSTNRWSEIPYNRVPSKCMANNSKHFSKHDGLRFTQYLQDVASGKRTITGATLLPHELLAAGARAGPGQQQQVIDAQWNTLVESVRASGTLDDCLAVCDVSGSMGMFQPGLYSNNNTHRPDPIMPALALTIILAQTAREPWRNRFITFSNSPELVEIDPSLGLVGMADAMSAAGWGMNTDYNAVFINLILKTAIRNRLKPDDMVKRLFVFSDMEFDHSQAPSMGQRRQSSQTAWESEHEIIRKAFEDAGYQLPEIVYWNLTQHRHGRTPYSVDKNEIGTALVTGFSPNMIKLFMEGEQVVPDVVEDSLSEGTSDQTPEVKARRDPLDVMHAALNKPSFAGLRVFD